MTANRAWVNVVSAMSNRKQRKHQQVGLIQLSVFNSLYNNTVRRESKIGHLST